MHGPVLLLLIRNAGEGGESVATIEAMHTLRRRAGAAASTAARERTAVQLVLLGGERHGAGVLRGVGVDNLDASPDGVRVTMEPRESPISRGGSAPSQLEPLRRRDPSFAVVQVDQAAVDVVGDLEADHGCA